MKKLKNPVVCLIFLLLFVGILHGTGILKSFAFFLDKYKGYINSNIERQAKLFENILSGLCAGSVTFGALVITILHENKKDRIFWEKEKQKDREERLLSVRPFLNIEPKSVSVVRTEKCDEEKDFVDVGQGKKYQYANVVLSNYGYGKCRKIMIDGHECSINQLNKNQEENLIIYFKGLKNNTEDKNFVMIVIYDDIFGNSYLQEFKCYLRCGLRELNIELGEALLRKEEE